MPNTTGIKRRSCGLHAGLSDSRTPALSPAALPWMGRMPKLAYVTSQCAGPKLSIPSGGVDSTLSLLHSLPTPGASPTPSSFLFLFALQLRLSQAPDSLELYHKYVSQTLEIACEPPVKEYSNQFKVHSLGIYCMSAPAGLGAYLRSGGEAGL